MIYIAGDKHGFRAIEFVKDYLDAHNLQYENLGVQNEQQDMKLEDMIPKVAEKIKEDESNKGILACGTGVGVEVGANKFSGIRACLAVNAKIAELAVVYDKCNVMCLAGWDSEKEEVFKILDAWLNAQYDGNEERLKMVKAFDEWH